MHHPPEGPRKRNLWLFHEFAFYKWLISKVLEQKEFWYFLYCKKSQSLKNRQKVSFFYRKSRILWLLKIKKKSLNWAIFFTYSGNRKKLTIFKIFLMQFFGQKKREIERKFQDLLMKQGNWIFAPKMNTSIIISILKMRHFSLIFKHCVSGVL